MTAQQHKFNIQTTFHEYEDVQVWKITNFEILAHIQWLHSHMYDFNQATFSWKYQILINYVNNNCITIQLKPQKRSSLIGILHMSAILYNSKKVKITETNNFNEIELSSSVNIDALAYNTIYIHFCINYKASSTVIIPTKVKAKSIQIWKFQMLEHLNKMYMNPKFSDITFYVQNVKFPAHQIILSSHSSVFRKMFKINMKEQQEKKVYIHGFTVQVFDCMLYYMYTGKLDNLRSLINELVFIAHMYDVKALIEECEKYFLNNMNTENVIDTLVVATKLNMHHLENVCIRYIISNKKQIISKREFDDVKEHHFDIAMKILDQYIAKLAKPVIEQKAP